MKRIDFGNAVGGVKQPLLSRSMEFLQDSYKEIFDALAQSIIIDKTLYNVLFGCVNSTPGGGTFTISAGAIYQNGEVYLVDAATLTPGGGQTVVLVLETTYQSGDPIQFSDGSTHNVHEIKKLKLQNGVSGSGLVDYSSVVFHNEKWNVVGASGQPAFQNSWNFNTNNVRFKKDKSGFLVMDGVAFGGSTGTVVFTLPVGYRPATSKRFYGASNAVDTSQVYIATNGDVSISYTSNGSVFLDSVRFALD